MLSLEVSVARQILTVLENKSRVAEYSISTALNGIGQQKSSGCTPLGKHYVRACIGAGQPLNAVFVGRRFTGEIFSDALSRSFPERDWILTRILWLCGSELGKNRLGDVDTMQRYIYIHGTPDSEPMGVPLSHGCIRMRNCDLIELFDRVVPGTEVNIHE